MSEPRDPARLRALADAAEHAARLLLLHGCDHTAAECDAIASLLRALAEEQEKEQPQLKWEGPDEDGDLVVSLVGMPKWHILGHGRTHAEALACIGGGLAVAGDPHD